MTTLMVRYNSTADGDYATMLFLSENLVHLLQIARTYGIVLHKNIDMHRASTHYWSLTSTHYWRPGLPLLVDIAPRLGAVVVQRLHPVQCQYLLRSHSCEKHISLFECFPYARLPSLSWYTDHFWYKMAPKILCVSAPGRLLTTRQLCVASSIQSTSTVPFAIRAGSAAPLRNKRISFLN
jgi:hypothetical protein